MIFFQGTDNKLWRANLDGSGGVNIGGFHTKWTPFVYGQSIYFQGTDDKFWRSNLDGSGGTNLANYKTGTAPYVLGNYIFFGGTDQKLWRLNLDGSGGVNIGGFKTKSTPFVSEGNVYFQGTDNKLWRTNLDGTGGVNLGANTTSSAPFVTKQYVYFRGTDDRLLRTNLDGTGGLNLGNFKTKSTPYVSGQHIYFQGTDDKLWQANLDGTHGVNLGGYKTKSSPVVDVDDQFVFFQGTDDKLWRLNLDGTHGEYTGFNTSSPPFVASPSNQPKPGTARPLYNVLTVLYAPPGTNGGHSSSAATYGSSSGTGTQTTVSSSFKAGVEVKATLGNPSILGASSDFTASLTMTDSSAFEVKSNQNFKVTVNGPASDGINHDEDYFYIWLNPLLDITFDPQNNLSWGLGVDGPTMIVQYVHAGWLKNPATMPAGLKQQLTAAGLTNADYQKILSLNPFSSGATTIDPQRFLPTPYSFPYNPPFAAGETSPLQSYELDNAVTTTTGQKSETQYGVSISASGGIKDVFSASLQSSFTWTNSSSTQQTTQSTKSASVTVGGPAFGYSGPADVLVYWDTVYNSFMFAFPTQPPTLHGVVTNKSGAPLTNTAVALTMGGHTFRTATDGKGECRFYKVTPGQARLTVAGETFSVEPVNGVFKISLNR